MEAAKLQLYFFFILFIAVGTLTFFIFKPFLPVLAIAAIFAVLLQPLYQKILKSGKIHEAVAAFLVLVIMGVFILTPLTLVMLQLFNESQSLYYSLVMGEVNYLDVLTSAIENPVRKFSPDFNLDIASYADQAYTWIFSNLKSVVSSTAISIFNILLAAVAFFFFLKDGSKFRKNIMNLSPLADEYNHEISNKLEISIKSVLKGTLLIAMIQGILAGVGFLIFGIPNSTLWGSVATIAALIPGLGTALVIGPCVLYLFFTGATLKAVGLLIWGAVMVGMIDNVLMSTLYGRGIKIHPLLVLFSVLGGIVFFGPMGFLFGPIAISLFYTLIDIYKTLILKYHSTKTAPTIPDIKL
jgi:predicted PurR-regulated permease PerM